MNQFSLIKTRLNFLIWKHSNVFNGHRFCQCNHMRQVVSERVECSHVGRWRRRKSGRSTLRASTAWRGARTAGAWRRAAWTRASSCGAWSSRPSTRSSSSVRRARFARCPSEPTSFRRASDEPGDRHRLARRQHARLGRPGRQRQAVGAARLAPVTRRFLLPCFACYLSLVSGCICLLSLFVRTDFPKDHILTSLSALYYPNRKKLVVCGKFDATNSS